MRLSERFTPEVIFVLVVFVAALLGVFFLGALVAPPKTLLGRSMTAIPPSLFPRIVLGGLAILCALFLFARLRGEPPAIREEIDRRSLQEGAAFFALLTFYALTMVPLGFFLSTALSMAALSWLVGNRSPVQITVLAVLAPAALYLAATRLLAVSLPELGAIELFWARLLP
ncbi:MAG: tripartite tricarboxylate transporter TctB family protein [Alphaproteobacteria bacterium]|nr:MAG: tripartite tricarboxylate transporter TctB family protein [Alphaproteobacteria bacterium]